MMLEYKGYIGVVKIDDEAKVFFGRVIGLRDEITFQGETVPEVIQAFLDSVDDYLAFCAQRGEESEKPLTEIELNDLLSQLPQEEQQAVENRAAELIREEAMLRELRAARAKKKPETSDAAEILHRLYFEGDPAMMAQLEEERANAAVAQLVYDLRTGAKLTQSELADRVGTTPSVISHIEDADYEGHSLSMLRRIADALNMRVQIQFVPKEPEKPSTGTDPASGKS